MIENTNHKLNLLGLNIIVGPDDKDVLIRCLESCKGELFDEIVITLAMPEDDPEIRSAAEKYTDKIFFFKWTEDFGAARNFSFSKSTTEHILWCFTPETRVHTENGLKAISGIKIGEKVLTHNGTYKKVTKIYRQPYRGEIIKLSSKYSDNHVGVTPNHEFYGCNSYKCKTGVKFCKQDCKKQYSKRYLRKYGKISKQCKQGYINYEKKFRPISEFNVGDIICFPRLKQTIFNPYFLDIINNEKARNKIPEKIEVTPELMRLFGYFVAEGTTSKDTVSFCFHKKETIYHKDVLFLMNKIFNIDGKEYYKEGPEGGGCTIAFCSVILSYFFNELFNGLQPVRRIPNKFLGLSDLHLSEFIRGYYYGGGGENPDSFAMTSSSPYLIEQIRIILSRFGIMAECIPYKAKQAWKIRIGGKSVSLFQEIILEMHDNLLKSQFNKNFYSDSGFIYHQIEEYKCNFYEGYVYNLEVEDDHTYVTEYMISHNCDSDDIIKPDNYKALLELKPQLHNWDIIICDYIYSHDEKDKPILVLPRERIVRNCPEIKWHDPIHEYMNLHGIQHKVNITIDHYRVKPHNPARNIEALGKIYDSGKASERIRFYYGKELSDYGSWDKALPVLESYINDGKDFRDNLTVACIKVAKYYYDKRDYNSSKNYALKGIRFNNIYAENYVILGSVYENEGMHEPAEQYYKEALNKTLDGGMSQLVDYYGFIPCAKLALLYFNKKEYEEGIRYAEKALEYKPENEHMKELSKAMRLELDRLLKGVTLKESDIKVIEDFLKSINFNMSIIKNNSDFSDIRIKKIKDLEVIWMIPFVDIINPSTRIRRYNIAVKMRALGIKSRIISEYYGRNNYEIRNDIGDATVVIFTFNHKHDIELIKHLKSAGITCIYDKCEAVFGNPDERIYLDEVDLVTCCSTKLESLLNERGYMKTCVIKDATEEKYPKKDLIYVNRYERPKAVYMGMGGNSFLVTEYLKDVIEKAGYDLIVISEWDNATIKWDNNKWPDHMVECDVALCPQRADIQPAKSEIKAITAMALGLPVIASPLPAYLEIIKDGENGFICESEDEWYDTLIALKNPELRKKIGEAGKKSVSNFNLTSITRQWEKNLLDLINGRMIFKKPPENIEVKNRSIVDIIIASYNNPEYLRLCVTSILMNTLYPFHLIISDGGSDEETWRYLKTLKGITIVGDPNKRLTFSETCNAGILASRTRYLVILNSDVIVSKYWLTNLVNKMDTVPRLAACGVLSNCDRGWLFDNPNKKDSPSYPMRLEKSEINLHPGMKINEIKPNIEELYKFMSQSNKKYKNTFIKQEWVATYATIFARSAINEVGLFDPLYKNGCEDLDLMIRLRKYGYEIGQSVDSFVFHFGGISRGAYELEDIKNYHKEDLENHQKHRLKWDKKRIIIWTGPAWEPWNKETVDAGMAGSETWATYLAREFVRMGYRTTIYNDLLIEDKNKVYLDPVLNESGKKVGDVIYRDYRNLKRDVEYDIVDYFISSRSLEPLKANVHSIRNYVMIHDIWISGDKNYDVMQWRIDKYAYLSEWHRKFIMQHHGIPPHKMFLTANGVNTDLYKNVDIYKKRNMTVYSSSPDRGLYQLLQMLPKIREEIPDFEIIVAYGFLNWESMAKMKNDTASMLFIDEIKKMMNQPGVNYVGRVNKKQLAEYQMQSNVWLYSSWFSETFCVGSVEAGLAKNPILTTDFAGLQTTVGDAGILLPVDGLSRNGAYPESYTSKFIEEAVRLIKDKDYRKEWADKAYNKMKEYTWGKIAQGWIDQFNS